MPASNMSNFLKFYIAVGAAVCLWFTVAAFAGWKAPKIFSGFGSGRGGGYYGGGWWGGK